MTSFPNTSDFIQQLSEGGRIVIQEEIVFEQGDISTGGVLSVASGTSLIFCGGKLVNRTGLTIIIEGDDINLIAGPEHIFAGDNPFEFRSPSTYTKDNITYHYPQNWTMERAYPQWFGATNCAEKISKLYKYFNPTGQSYDPEEGNSKIDAIEDASYAINAAIRLKRTGEVHIPRGFYKICNYINVLPGIKLIGEGTQYEGFEKYGTVLFPWRSTGNLPVQLNNLLEDKRSSVLLPAATINNVELKYIHFPKHPSDTDWRNQANYPLEYGYMILAGISEKCSLTYRENERYPRKITYYNSDQGQINVPGIEIRNLTLKRIEYDGVPDYRLMRGILMHAAIKLDSVRMYGLSQLCCCTAGSNDYDDMRMVERCAFTPPAFTELDTINTLYPTAIYAFDLAGWGDALNFRGNHASTYCEKIGALRLRFNNGSSVEGNILNSDVVIDQSRGVDFAANHMEYGSKLTISSSATSVRNNYIWRGQEPAIVIRRNDEDGYAHCHSSVELSNNQLFWRSQHTPGEPQNARSLYPYDIRTDGYASIHISNTFRNCNRQGPMEGSYFGVLMQWIEMRLKDKIDGHLVDVEFGEANSIKTEFTEYNRISHIASVDSHIVGRKVTPMPTTIVPGEFFIPRGNFATDTVHFLARRIEVGQADAWKSGIDSPGTLTYDYCAWMLADVYRSILIPNPRPYSGQTHRKAIVLGQSYNNANYPDYQVHTQPCSSGGKHYNLRLMIGMGEHSNYNVPAGPYWLYVERRAYNAGILVGLAGVMIPVSAASQLWDDGQYLSGYEWEIYPLDGSNADSMESLKNVCPSRVTFTGENVECVVDNVLPKLNGTLDINGAWVKGDIIREVANGFVTSWLKTSSGWKTI